MYSLKAREEEIKSRVREDYFADYDCSNYLGNIDFSVAMKKLRELEYIVVSDAGYITLTKAGKKVADSVYERHQIITDLLISLGVKKSIAAEDACKVEHVISDESFSAIKKAMHGKN